MHEIALYISVFLGAVALYIIMDIYREYREKRRWVVERRFNLIRQIVNLRLSRMLNLVGLGYSTYVSETSEEQIKQHIQNCVQCDNTTECDEYFRGKRSNRNIKFCPNIQYLYTIKLESQIRD